MRGPLKGSSFFILVQSKEVVAISISSMPFRCCLFAISLVKTLNILALVNFLRSCADCLSKSTWLPVILSCTPLCAMSGEAHRPPTSHSCAHAFTVSPRGVQQAVGKMSQVSRADAGSAFRVSLPCRSQKRARYGTPQLGASGPLGE